MNKIIIPNIVTSLNLLSGVAAIYVSLSYENYLYLASIFIIVASIFDFFDGFVARLLKAQSEFGKQMDSFADLVSFGLAPTFIMFKLLEQYSSIDELKFIAFVIVIFSAIRLSIFNITDQKYEFVGLATPAFALFVVSIPLIRRFPYNLMNFSLEFIVINQYFLVVTTLIFSVLLVSKIKMFSLKFRDYKFSTNRIRYFFIIISIFLFIFLLFSAIPVILIVYILISVIFSSKALAGK